MEDPKKKYLRNIIFLNIQKKEMIELTKNSIKRKKPIPCKLVNKDIINDYINKEISNLIYSCLDTYMINYKINNYIELYDENHINHIINENYHKIKDIDFENKFFNPGLIMEEYSKLKNIEYPSNFFILRKFVFDEIIANESLLLQSKTYDVLIGKEGTLIWDEKPNEYNEFKLIIYYIKDIKIDEECNVNKIIILRNKEKKYIENLDIYLQLSKIRDKPGYLNIVENGQ